MQVEDNGLLDRNDLKRLSLMVEVFLDPGQACFDKGLGGSTMLESCWLFRFWIWVYSCRFRTGWLFVDGLLFTWEINQYFGVGIKNIKPV